MKIIAVYFCLSTLILAQVNPVKVNGFVDFYYAYDFNKPLDMNRSYTTQPLRHNEFNLNFATLGVSYSKEMVRGNFTLQTGTYVQSNFTAELPLFKNIFEASIGTKLGNIWIDVGIFPSHIGLEGILSNTNWTYSRSLASDYSPFFETGIRITSELTNQISAGLLLLNGWQNIRETNSDKAFGTYLKFIPSNDALINWSTFLGNEIADSLASQFRIFNDFYYQQNVSNDFQFAVLFDIGLQQNSEHTLWNSWHTGYLMIKYLFSPQISASARIEYFSDSKGIIAPTGTANNFQTTGASINLDFTPVENVMWRIEFRNLFSKDEIYPSNNSVKSTDSFIVLSSAISL